MPSPIDDLLTQRMTATTEIRRLVDLADTEKRLPTAEEDASIAKAEADVRSLDERIKSARTRARLESLEKAGEELRSEVEKGNERRTELRTTEQGAGNGTERATDERRIGVFRRYLIGGKDALGTEERTLIAGSDSKGGTFILPLVLMNQFIKQMDDLLWIRNLATSVPIGASQSIGCPTMTADYDDAEWTGEGKDVTPDTAIRLGRRDMSTNLLKKKVKIGQRLLELSSRPVEAFVLERLAYRFALTEEKAFLTGSGVGKPLGIFTASDAGVPTSRDVSTGNTTTALTFDGLIAAFYGLKQAYRRTAVWIFNRSVIEGIVKIKDGNGNYIFQPAVRESEADTLKGRPIYESEYAPNTMTAGLYVGILADLSHYWIAEAGAMTMQRLAELYSETDEIGFIGRRWIDGAPVLAEAFSRVKLAP